MYFLGHVHCFKMSTGPKTNQWDPILAFENTSTFLLLRPLACNLQDPSHGQSSSESESNLEKKKKKQRHWDREIWFANIAWVSGGTCC